MNTHETYVSLETAKLLKQAGFNWECHSCYQNENFQEFSFSSYYNMVIMDFNSAPEYMNQYSAPTLDIVQKWLREVKGIEVYSHVFYDYEDMSNGWDVYVYEVNHITKQIEDYISSYNIYHSYEEALETGMQECIKKILAQEKQNTKFKIGDKVIITKGKYAGSKNSDRPFVCAIKNNKTYNVLFIEKATDLVKYVDFTEDQLHEHIENGDTVVIIDGKYKESKGILQNIKPNNTCVVKLDENKIVNVPIMFLKRIL